MSQLCFKSLKTSVQVPGHYSSTGCSQTELSIASGRNVTALRASQSKGRLEGADRKFTSRPRMAATAAKLPFGGWRPLQAGSNLQSASRSSMRAASTARPCSFKIDESTPRYTRSSTRISQPGGSPIARP